MTTRCRLGQLQFRTPSRQAPSREAARHRPSAIAPSARAPISPSRRPRGRPALVIAMLDIPKSYKEINPDASILYLCLHVEAAIAMMREDRLWPFAETVAGRDLVAIGIDRFNSRRAAQPLPVPWTGRVGEFVVFDVTPCTRPAFASVTAHPGAARVERRDVVAVCISHEALRALGRPTVYVDRMCTRAEANFSGDRDLLGTAAWARIRTRNLRAAAEDPEEVFRYDAGALVWGPVPTSLAAAVVCKDAATAAKVRAQLPATRVEALPDLLW